MKTNASYLINSNNVTEFDSNTSYHELMDIYICPISGKPMEDPVIDHEGNSYEKKEIEEFIKLHKISPITRNPLSLKDLKPNRALKDAILLNERAVERNSKESIPDVNRKSKFWRFNLFKYCQTDTTLIEHDEIITEAKKQLETFEPYPPKIVIDIPNAMLSGNIYIVNDDYQNDNSLRDFTNNTNAELELNTHISVLFNQGPRIPTDAVVAIDVSASMNAKATTQEIENCQLSVLDIVKHAVKTIIQTLGANDRLAIVKFSNCAVTVLPLTRMDDKGKDLAEQALAKLQPNGMTNLWDAIEMGLNILKVSKDSNLHYNKNSAIFVMTDGEPNIIPTDGNLTMLELYKQNCGNEFPGIIHTFGFGYALDSKLLSDIATMGGGMFSFIPDSGFVGTVFVNALANTLATVVSKATLRIIPLEGVRIENGERLESSPRIIEIYGIQSGQSKDVIIKTVISKSFSGSVMKVDLSYCPNNFSPGENFTEVCIINYNENIKSLESNATNLEEYNSQLFRLKFIEAISNTLKIIPVGSNDKKIIAGKVYLQTLLFQINDWIEKHQNLLPENDESCKHTNPFNRISSLKKDLDEQISKAMSRSDWYDRWGVHYLISLKKAHELQQCSNFKDSSIQYYGGSVFNDIRDRADEIFCNLPPPSISVSVPLKLTERGRTGSSEIYKGSSKSFSSITGSDDSNSSIDNNGHDTPTKLSITKDQLLPSDFMKRFNDKDVGCIHESCFVTLRNNSIKLISELKRGDTLLDGKTIYCIMRTKCFNKSINFVTFPNTGLIITPWHPIIENNKWIFPVNSKYGEVKKLKAKFIYSFLVTNNKEEKNDNEYAESMVVNNTKCITLAHGIIDDKVAWHNFLGSSEIVKCLKTCKGWNDGLVTLDSSKGNCIKRNAITGLIEGFEGLDI